MIILWHVAGFVFDLGEYGGLDGQKFEFDLDFWFYNLQIIACI